MRIDHYLKDADQWRSHNPVWCRLVFYFMIKSQKSQAGSVFYFMIKLSVDALKLPVNDFVKPRWSPHGLKGEECHNALLHTTLYVDLWYRI